jgi:hypothetical protein
VLTHWAVDVLRDELERGTETFYLLTNSRSLPAADAQRLNRTIGENLLTASRLAKRTIAVVSRSDSTLRGHFPAEVGALASALETAFDAWLIIPCFFEGGRYTIGNTHYAAEGDQLIPVGETPYAQDAAFGYHASDLMEWVAEKTGGKIAASAVASISLDDIRRGAERRDDGRVRVCRGAATQAQVALEGYPRELQGQEIAFLAFSFALGGMPSAVVASKSGGGHPAGTQPKGLRLIQDDAGALTIYHRAWLIPTEIAVIHRAFIVFAVVDEEELLILSVFKVSVIAIGCVAVDAGRLATGGSLLVTSVKK